MGATILDSWSISSASPFVKWQCSLVGAGSSVSWGGQCNQGKSRTALSFAFGLALWQGAVASSPQRCKIL